MADNEKRERSSSLRRGESRAALDREQEQDQPEESSLPPRLSPTLPENIAKALEARATETKSETLEASAARPLADIMGS